MALASRGVFAETANGRFKLTALARHRHLRGILFDQPQVVEAAARCEVAPAGTLRVVGGDRDVVGDPEGRDAWRRVGCARRREDRLRRRRRTHVAQEDAQLHGATVPARATGANVAGRLVR